MNITQKDFKAIMPYATEANLQKFHAPLIESMGKYVITTPKRAQAFIAQLAHESGSFLYVRELASGQAYEGRENLGNTQPGDGKRFRGRGLIQVTGRDNYAAVSKALGVDFIANPELLETAKYATLSACWFWKTHGLNELADAGAFLKISKAINLGDPNSKHTPNGNNEREAFYKKAQEVIK